MLFSIKILKNKMNAITAVYMIGFLSLISSFVLCNKTLNLQNLPEVRGDKFYYFGYGSNMLTKRIHIQNPTAIKIGPGELRVSFYFFIFNGLFRFILNFLI